MAMKPDLRPLLKPNPKEFNKKERLYFYHFFLIFSLSYGKRYHWCYIDCRASDIIDTDLKSDRKTKQVGE